MSIYDRILKIKDKKYLDIYKVKDKCSKLKLHPFVHWFGIQSGFGCSKI